MTCNKFQSLTLDLEKVVSHMRSISLHLSTKSSHGALLADSAIIISAMEDMLAV